MTQLIINKRGSNISIKEGRFCIKNHDEKNEIPIGKVNRIMMHPSTSLTFDVVKQAAENDIDLLFFDRKGNVLARMWSGKFGSIATVRKNQLLFANNNETAVEYTKKNLYQKTENQLLILSLIGLRVTDEFETTIAHAIARIKHYQKQILQLKPITRSDDFATLRGYEGRCSDYYFETISNVLPDQYRFKTRSRMPAQDMFNALLNYAYGIMYAHVESALIQAGIDPYAGIFHRDDYNRPVLTYDVIEKYRHWADFVVIDLCLQQAIFIEFFDIEKSGFYLNDSGKKILITTFNDYMDEVIEVKSNQRSRLNHITLDAQKLAQTFKNYKP